MEFIAYTLKVLTEEGVHAPWDLLDFNRESIKTIANSIRRQKGDNVPRPHPAQELEGSTMTKSTPKFGAKSQTLIVWASETVRYYQTMSCKITANEMQWNTCIKNLKCQWEDLEGRSSKNQSIERPRMSKNLVIIKWSKSMNKFSHRKVRARNIVLRSALRNGVAPRNLLPPLAENRPHSKKHGSIDS